MKKVFWLLLICMVLAIGAGCAEVVLIDEIDMQLALGESWVIVTRDTGDVDLSGTPMDADWFYEVVEDAQKNLQKEENENVVALRYFYDGKSFMGSSIIAYEDKVSKAIWDLSLTSEEWMETQEPLDLYSNSAGERFLGYQYEASGEMEKTWFYVTYSNGRAVTITNVAFSVENEERYVELCHEVLDGISFTEKTPRPAATGTSSPFDREPILIDEIHMQIDLNELWFVVTRDTGDVDLTGTLMDADGYYKTIQENKEKLLMEENEDAFAVAFFCDGKTIIETSVIVLEDEMSKAVWDLSLMSEEWIAAQEPLETYTNSAGDLFVGFRQKTSNEKIEDKLYYITFISGRGVRITNTGWSIENEERWMELCHEILDGISFTEKTPKPAVAQYPLQALSKYKAGDIIGACSSLIALIVALALGFGLAYYKRISNAKDESICADDAIGVSVEQTALGMKWHKFLIYFSLWAGAMVLFSRGYSILVGNHLGGESEYVYAIFPLQSLVDFTTVCCCMILAVFAVLTRYQLADYKRLGPAMLKIFFAMQGAVNIGSMYGNLTALRNGGESVGNVNIEEAISMDARSVVTSIIIVLFMMGINHIYYKKRSALFVR